MFKPNEGTIFVAYKGEEVTGRDIRKVMQREVKPGYQLKEYDYDSFLGSGDNIYFAKIVPGDDYRNREPYEDNFLRKHILTVSGYEQEDLKAYFPYYEKDYPVYSENAYHKIFNYIYRDSFSDDNKGDFREFTRLANRGLDFCTVVYCEDDISNTRDFGAFVSKASGKYTHLYFGYPKLPKTGHDIMFSNSWELLKQFCVETYELKPKHYILNGLTYNANEDLVRFKDAVVPGMLSAPADDVPGFIPGISIPSGGRTITTKSNNEITAQFTSPAARSAHELWKIRNTEESEREKAQEEARKEILARRAAIRKKKIQDQINESFPNSSISSNPITSGMDDGSTRMEKIESMMKKLKKVSEIPNFDRDFLQGKSYEEQRKIISRAAGIDLDELERLMLEELEESIRETYGEDQNSNNISEDEIKKIVKDALDEYFVKGEAAKKIEEEVNKKVDEQFKQLKIPAIHIVKLKNKEIGRTGAGFFHKEFENILQHVNADFPPMLIGPAGGGKNHTIKQVADALGLKMYYTNNAQNEFKLTGFIDAGGIYRETEFYRAFKNGGVFFLDEIDNSDPSSLIVINSALANDYMAFPHETINKHEDFRMVAAANTWGKGSDMQYVGRNALDASTLDRFDTIYFDYDRNLEECLYPNRQVLEFMWAFRDAVEDMKVQHIVSTRGIGKVFKKDSLGFPTAEILKTNIIKNLSQDELNLILDHMNIDHTNKYYVTAKTLKLGK